jgi:hypothetical protein
VCVECLVYTGMTVHEGWNCGVVYAIFGHEGRFYCSAFDRFYSVLWFVSRGQGWRGVVVSGLYEVGKILSQVGRRLRGSGGMMLVGWGG